ncbi:DNA repair protein-like protein Rad7 [Biscogniauxia sp. FL1348]|nr:DNA repair protein-like protein Rad7 [Biscogniauxia sp. FL1348]
MANCEMCEKRFTVTPYSRSGPNGGLLCPKCSKEIAKDEDAIKKKKKKKPNAIPSATRSRRSLHSRILDGTYQTGAKPLMTLCIETLAKNIELADDLGDLPAPLIDRISRMLSKRRLLDGRTLDLFLQPHAEDLKVYDAARLSSDDYIRIFQTLSHLKKLKLRNAIQFKDNVMSYLISRHITLDSIYLHGANLLTEDCWTEYLKAKGQHLKALQVYFTDKHFTDDIVKSLNEHCPSLARLKICHNQQVSDEGVKHIAHIQKLEHLSLRLVKPTSTEAYIVVVKSIGNQLRTLSLEEVENVDDRLLDALHDNCTSLTKLRITGSRVMTDAGFARLFKDWKNKPLMFVDLEQCRHVDAAKPRENAHQIGLCSDGFRAMMNHSGKTVKHLNVHSCRHISREAFEEVFSIDKQYPELVNLEISFCEQVTDFIVGCIFRSCPNLKKLNVFGCMKVKDVKVPKGKILVGLPNAMGMVIEGKDD